MSISVDSLRLLSDEALTAQVKECVASEGCATAALIASLAEFDVRRLYLELGARSLFTYYTDHLHLSERAAYSRIEAARLVRRFPVILGLIADCRVSLSAISILARHLNEANHRSLLEEATHKTIKEIEVMVARIAPRADVQPLVRRIPDPSSSSVAPPRSHVVHPMSASADALRPPAPPSVVPPARSVVQPLAPERFKVQFTISGETRAKLKATQDLLRHSVPSGDLAEIFDRGLSALLADLEKKKLAIVARPRGKTRQAKPGSRVIPASVRRGVWRRDRGRCAFVGTDGRCRERGQLEFHHMVPFAAGGAATIDNIELRCRAHNAHEADVSTSLRSFPRD